jgi:4-amino-4-deoxy-L-arabinose transferase-like glycosyltransferase
MNAPNPALVTQRAAERLPRLALLLFCAAWVVPGVFGRDPWRNADVTAFGVMSAIAEGRTAWFAPMLGGVPVDAPVLPHALGAFFIMLLSPLVDPALAARMPFAILLALTLACTWYTTFHLARTDAALPVAFAFGGEAAPIDYARAIADAAVLALIATLGVLQLGHETTPELVQLFATSLFLWSLAAAPYRLARARLAVVVSLLILASSGAPTLALVFGAVGTLICARSTYVQARAFAWWVAGATLIAVLLSAVLGAWEWRFALEPTAAQAVQIARQWIWFMWPTGPLALWTVWRWRRQLLNRHVSVPLATVISAMGANVWMGGNDRALLLALPGLAVLAAFALPTLRRSASALIDWFSMFFFTLSALTIWVIYVAMHTGVPARPAANVAKLAPGFEAPFSAFALAVAVAGTLLWLALLRWRTGRYRHALWKSLVLPAGGVALCWLLLMTLWLPLLDYARSARPMVDRLARHVAGASCVATPGMNPALVASLEVFGRLRVDARGTVAAARCPVLLLVTRGSRIRTPPGWRLVASERRTTDRSELVSVYRRTDAR